MAARRRSDYDPPIAEDILAPHYHIEDPNGEWPDDTEPGCCEPGAPLIPFHPQPIVAGEILGKTITRVSRGEGTYGQGGLGFFSLTLADQKLVVALSSVAEWIHVNGTMIEDPTWTRHGGPPPLCADWRDSEKLEQLVVGKAIVKATFGRQSFSIELADGTLIALEEDATKRPLDYFTDLPNGMLKQFPADVDIRVDIFLMPNTTLWS